MSTVRALYPTRMIPRMIPATVGPIVLVNGRTGCNERDM